MSEFLEIVNKYISKANTDYALILNGEWGTGKTFYIENVIIPNLPKEYTVLFLSLVGIQSITEIKEKIVYNYLSSNKERKDKNKTKYYKLADMIIELGIDIDLFHIKDFAQLGKFAKEKHLYKAFNNISTNKLIMIFDDLERIDCVSINEIMRFIHNSFTIKSVKVIYISDENHIVDKNKYNEIKEKYIRITHLFNPSLNDLLCDCLKSLMSDKLYNDFIIGQLNTIELTFENAGHRNLRTFFYICDLFLEIFDFVSKNYEQHKDVILMKYFQSLLILSIEQKLGKEDRFDSDLLSFEKRQFSLRETEETDGYLLNFKNKYINMSGLEFNYYSEVVNLIRHGIFDKNGSRKTIENIMKNENRIRDSDSEKAKYEALSVVKNYRKYNESELLDFIDKLLSFVKEGAYPIDYYYEIYCIFRTIISEELYKLKSLDEIKNIIEQGFIDSIKTITNEEKDIIIDDMHEIMENMGINEPDDFIKRLKSISGEYSKKNSINQDKKYIIDIFEAMKSNDDNEFRKKYQLFDKKKFFESIIKTHSLNLLDNMEIKVIYWIENILSAMLDTSNMLEVYSNQKTNIKEIQEHIRKNIDGESDPFRHKRLCDLIGLFEKVLKRFPESNTCKKLEG